MFSKTTPDKPGKDLGAYTSIDGIPQGDATHPLNVGGYIVSSDVALFQKQQTFNRHKIVERMVHPCGAGVFGYFETTTDFAAKHCKAKFLESPGKRTQIYVRFSTTTFGREFPDSARNPRGMAIKFYTEEGNYDIVGLNFPVFFVRNPSQGPDVIRSQRRNPKNFLVDWNALWDFLTEVPESLHCGTMLFSDHGTPYGFRHMHGYGCHTFKWVNASNEQFYVKYHFICEQGIRNFSWDAAVKMCGEDPDFAKRDLWQSVEKGEKNTWKVCVQLMPVEDAPKYRWNPFDVTKVWNHSDYPLHEIGRFVLTHNPQDYHRDVEEAAFSPGAMVPGIEPSPDMLLQFRCFFYRDAQLYRLGVNLHQIPVNCPFMAGKLHPLAKDGLLRVDDNGQDDPPYCPYGPSAVLPNTNPPQVEPKYDWQPVGINGVLHRHDSCQHAGSLEEDLEPTRQLYTKVMSSEERERLHYNIAVTLKFAHPDVQKKLLALLRKVDKAYEQGVAKCLSTLSLAPLPSERI